MAPHECIFLVLLGKVEFGNEPIVGAREEDGGDLLAELKACDFLIETLGEFASLLHLAQIPKNHSFGRSSC